MWAILQTGLERTWIVSSTIDKVVLANVNVEFAYVGLFQNNTLGPRYQKQPVITSVPCSDFASKERYLRSIPNLKVVALASVWAAEERPPKGWTGRLGNFNNDVHQLRLIRDASKLVPRESKFVVRIREDASWYTPFALPHNPKDIWFRNCRSFNAYSDKVWLGPREAVLDLIDRYFATFLSGSNAVNTEAALKLAASNFSKSFVSIGVSDARESSCGQICYLRGYACLQMHPNPFCTYGP